MIDQLRTLMADRRCDGMTAIPIATIPFPIAVIGWQGSWLDETLANTLTFLIDDLTCIVAKNGACGWVRCVGLERLSVILKTGCDIEPTNSVLWLDMFPDKALEYGGDEKVMMIFNLSMTEPSYVKVPANTDAAKLKAWKQNYPTVLSSIDGKELWLSRLPEHDRRVGSPYEVEHARWIPGDPLEALLGIFVLGRNPATLTQSILQHLSNSQVSIEAAMMGAHDDFS